MRGEPVKMDEGNLIQETNHHLSQDSDVRCGGIPLVEALKFSSSNFLHFMEANSVVVTVSPNDQCLLGIRLVTITR